MGCDIYIKIKINLEGDFFSIESITSITLLKFHVFHLTDSRTLTLTPPICRCCGGPGLIPYSLVVSANRGLGLFARGCTGTG